MFLEIHTFESLFRQSYVSLCEVAVRYTFSKTDAEILAQKFFTDLWEKRDRLNFDKIDDVQAFLSTAVRKRAIQACKCKTIKHGRRIAFTQHDHDLHDYCTLQKEINTAIEHLPSEYKNVFTLNRRKGQSYEQIADELKMTPEVVENHISLALQMLQKWLEDDKNNNKAF